MSSFFKYAFIECFLADKVVLAYDALLDARHFNQIVDELVVPQFWLEEIGIFSLYLEQILFEIQFQLVQFLGDKVFVELVVSVEELIPTIRTVEERSLPHLVDLNHE